MFVIWFWSQVRELEVDLDNETRRAAETQKLSKKQERRLKDVLQQQEEDQKNMQHFKDQVDRLNKKIKSTKTNQEEAVCPFLSSYLSCPLLSSPSILSFLMSFPLLSCTVILSSTPLSSLSPLPISLFASPHNVITENYHFKRSILYKKTPETGTFLANHVSYC